MLEYWYLRGISMGNEQLQTRFTDEKYATRQEVARVLGTNLIDPIWNDILAYRHKFLTKLSLVDFTNTPYSICFAHLINDQIGEVNQKAFDFKNVYQSMDHTSLDFKHIESKLFKNCLRSIALANNQRIDDVSLENILAHRNIDPQFSSYERYLNAFNLIDVTREINDEVLADFYVALTGNPELVEFYRSHDLNQSQQNVIIGREYSGAPVEKIESQMEALFSFIRRDDIPSVVKVCVVNFIFNVVKPFSKYNREMSALVCKSIMMKKFGPVGTYIPVEKLMSEQQLVVASLEKEVQRTRDLTYIITKDLEILTAALEDVANVFVHHSLEQLEIDQRQDEIRVRQEHEQVAPVRVEPKPVRPEPKPFVPEQPKVVYQEAPVVLRQEELSEKELQRLTEELLETDPNLRKGQAHFYIRHREKGHFYTIEQYRKCEKCVYETARTSMDNLVLRGYYRREKVNNKKFVYTPIFK